MTITKGEKKKKLDLLKQIRDERISLTTRINKQESEHLVIERKRLNYEKENKLLYFTHPDKGYLGKHGKWDYNPIQKRFFKALKNPVFTIFTLTGSNRISKTFSTTGVSALTMLRGCFPWEDPKEVGHWFWELRDWEPPIKIRIVGQDWEKHIKGTIIPSIKELWPKSWQIKSKKNNVGVEAYYSDVYTGGTIEIMSNKSESDLFEGWHGHAVIYDEPPKRDVRVACARGLIDYEGIEFFAMTLLKEAWVEETIMNMELPDGTPDPCVFSATGHIDGRTILLKVCRKKNMQLELTVFRRSDLVSSLILKRTCITSTGLISPPIGWSMFLSISGSQSPTISFTWPHPKMGLSMGALRRASEVTAPRLGIALSRRKIGITLELIGLSVTP